MRNLPRITVQPLLLLWLSLLPTASAWSQTVEHDESEVLESSAKAEADDNVDPAEVADRIMQQTNEFRESHGRQEVEANSKLMDAAEYFSNYMARTDRYGHHADGQKPSQRAKNHGYELCIIAENIAYQFNSAGFTTSELATRFVEGWENSPPHRRNMLDRDVRDIGVAVARSEQTGHWYAVQMFGRPKSAAVEFKIANRSDVSVDYSIRNRTFQLPPGYTRTHLRCRETKVEFDFPGGEGRTETIQPNRGDRFTIVRQNGELDVRQ